VLAHRLHLRVSPSPARVSRTSDPRARRSRGPSASLGELPILIELSSEPGHWDRLVCEPPHGSSFERRGDRGQSCIGIRASGRCDAGPAIGKRRGRAAVIRTNAVVSVGASDATTALATKESCAVREPPAGAAATVLTSTTAMGVRSALHVPQRAWRILGVLRRPSSGCQ
jgi:hypothetical protein